MRDDDVSNLRESVQNSRERHDAEIMKNVDDRCFYQVCDRAACAGREERACETRLEEEESKEAARHRTGYVPSRFCRPLGDVGLYRKS